MTAGTVSVVDALPVGVVSWSWTVSYTGTGSGNIPVLDGSGRLPAVDGSQLTGITSTQVSGLGTAASATVGTAANNVPQLSSSAVMPEGTVYPSQTWTNRWTYADGSPLANGWTTQGVAMTIAAMPPRDVPMMAKRSMPSVSSARSVSATSWSGR